VVGGFGSPGIRLRRRLFGWQDLPSLEGRSVVLTGATSGLGRAAATQMQLLGARLTILGRDRDRTNRAAQEITAGNPAGHPVRAALADLTSIAAARTFAEEYAAGHEHLDVLVHNAGALSAGYERTPEGYEATYAAQVLSPHVITTTLLTLLARSDAPRVITVSSGGMYTRRLDPPRMQMDAEHYDGVTAYALAKRAQVVMTQQWAERFGHLAQFHSMHPGWADTPGVLDSLPTFHRITRPLLRTPEEGADTITWLAGVDPIPGPNGSFWLDRRPRGTAYIPGTSTTAAASRELWELVCQQSGAAPLDPPREAAGP
jgi:NAD(P)-dependent dehydrogenase (short-subunit alcohol dehydrogenase family)